MPFGMSMDEAAEVWADFVRGESVPPDGYREPRRGPLACRSCGSMNVHWERSARTGRFYLAAGTSRNAPYGRSRRPHFCGVRSN